MGFLDGASNMFKQASAQVSDLGSGIFGKKEKEEPMQMPAAPTMAPTTAGGRRRRRTMRRGRKGKKATKRTMHRRKGKKSAKRGKKGGANFRGDGVGIGGAPWHLQKGGKGKKSAKHGKKAKKSVRRTRSKNYRGGKPKPMPWSG